MRVHGSAAGHRIECGLGVVGECNEVVAIYGDLQTVIDDGISNWVTLNKGRNGVPAAIVDGRFLDAADKPTKGFMMSLK